MANFVLVHGGFHGAWCWAKVGPLLSERGHGAVALDMPGNGADMTPHDQITMECYAQKICGALETADEPVILVGHSLGGMSISLAAERHPERIKRLIYLAGFVPSDGQSLLSSMDAARTVAPGTPVFEDGWSGLTQPVPPAAENIARFYNDCSEEDIAYALPRLKPQVNAPRVTPVHLTEARFGSVPRIFIACEKDNAMSPERRKAVAEHGGCEKVLSLPTGHSPFFSEPEMLAIMLDAISELE
jgi:pimeloyl-ACP methyl ester carboxylesterase